MYGTRKKERKIPLIEIEKKGPHNVGILLRDARKEKKLTIKDVSESTRIRQVYIKALEEGKLDHLPGTAYRIGFIKTYALFLGLDGGELLRRLHFPSDESIHPSFQECIVPSLNQSQPGKKVLYVSFVASFSFCFIAYFLNVHYRLDIPDPPLFLEEPSLLTSQQLSSDSPFPKRVENKKFLEKPDEIASLQQEREEEDDIDPFEEDKEIT